MVLVIALVSPLALGGGGAQAPAEQVTYGDLKLGFVDRHGDLVADAPTNPSQLIDPPTLVFASTPVEDPEVYRDVWSEFIDHLSTVTGKPVQFFPVQFNAAQLEAMIAGRLHIAGFNTGRCLNPRCCKQRL